MENTIKRIRYRSIAWLILLVVVLAGCAGAEGQTNQAITTETFDYNNIPAYSGEPYIEVNQNIPYFTEEEIVEESYETYGELDSLGRCTTAAACLSVDTMPADEEERGEIGNVKPTGWNNAKYDCVEGKYVQNRAHMIGWQLGAENANEKNLVTGTRYMNIEMLDYENEVAEYIRDTENHVMYRVTPVFVDEELLCRGLLLEGYSVEDEGKEISFCVYFYNVQPGIAFNYQTGESWYTGEVLDWDSTAVNYEALGEESKAETKDETEVSPLPEEDGITYVLNRNTKKFHLESCEGVSKMKEENKEIYEGNRDYLLSIGYEPCKQCNP